MKENKKIIIIFVSIILILIGVFCYYEYKNRRNTDERKVNILGNFSYAEVVELSNQIFLNAVKILNANNLEVETNHNNVIRFYSINDYDEYKKINNFLIVINTLNISDLRKYMEEKRIIKVDNNYYIENYEDITNQDYIGSIIEISDYDDKYIYFNSENYYCADSEYIGLLETKPTCDYTIKNTTFKLVLEEDELKISNIEDIRKIIA